MLPQSKSSDFSIVWSNSYSKLYFTFWAWSDYNAFNEYTNKTASILKNNLDI